jgi:hypothetical protein
MPRWQRVAILATCAVIGGAFAYAASDWGRWPKLTYLPVRGELTLHAPAGAIAIGYYGLILWALGGTACGTLVGAALCRLVPRPWPVRTLHLLAAWAATAILLAGLYFTWSLWPW